MIVGIGVDIVEIARIRQSLAQFGQRFVTKVLAPEEQERFAQAHDSAAWLARRFAAKEAAAKALGTGMRGGVHFSQIRVDRRKSGAPALSFSGNAAARADKLSVAHSHISISDEREYAIAYVVLEGGP